MEQRLKTSQENEARVGCCIKKLKQQLEAVKVSDARVGRCFILRVKMEATYVCEVRCWMVLNFAKFSCVESKKMLNSALLWKVMDKRKACLVSKTGIYSGV